MSAIYCTIATFERLSSDAQDDNLLRVKADGRHLFTDRLALDQRGFRLDPGQSVFMGVEPLEDGTFRVHWLHAPGLGTAVDVTSPSPLRMAVLGATFLLVGVLALTSSVALLAIIVGLLALMASGLGFLRAGQTVCWMLSPKRRRLQTMLDSLLRGDIDTIVPLRGLGFPPGQDFASLRGSDDHGPRAVEGTCFSLVQGTAKGIETSSVEGGRKMHWEHVTYEFTCAGHPVSFLLQKDRSFLGEYPDNCHPFMLAEGDRVRLVLKEDKKTVLAAANLEDGSVYWMTEGRGKRDKQKRERRLLWGSPALLSAIAIPVYLLVDVMIWWFVPLVVVGCSLSLAFWVKMLNLSDIPPDDRHRRDRNAALEALGLEERDREAVYVHEL